MTTAQILATLSESDRNANIELAIFVDADGSMSHLPMGCTAADAIEDMASNGVSLDGKRISVHGDELWIRA